MKDLCIEGMLNGTGSVDSVMKGQLTLCEKCPYSELFWSAFSLMWIEYGEILRISPYLVQMREMRTRITPNTDTFKTTLKIIYEALQHLKLDAFEKRFKRQRAQRWNFLNHLR